ncbi:MAG: DNA/RNA non-specific endonuclease [Aestuariivita sp.]|nr:DNA/RNA non-specific endonuclease [Aestuariivita sp.]
MGILGSALTAVLLQTLIVVASMTMANTPLVQEPPEEYDHDRFSPKPDIERAYPGFIVSFDSKDEDDDVAGRDILRVPHWVSQEVRRWEPREAFHNEDKNWCLDSLVSEPAIWFTDTDLFGTGVAPDDDSYRDSGFDKGQMAMALLVERIGSDAAYDTYTVINAIPQRPKFSRGIWQNLSLLTGAWAQKYGKIWLIQGPVFYDQTTIAWIGDKEERKVAVPDAAFKIVVRDKTEKERLVAEELEQDAPEVLAFLYPQLGPAYFGAQKDYRHSRFLTTVDEVEELTGLDFKLSNDPDAERRLESRRAEALWEPIEVDLSRRQLFISKCDN